MSVKIGMTSIISHIGIDTDR